MTTREEMRKSSPESPPPTSFSSLPDDVALNCLARVPKFYRPTLSVVSKGFRSLIASPELDATRSRIGITEDCIYICLDLNQNNPNPRWFTLAPIPNQEKLKPIPSFPDQHLESSTVLSVGSEIYIIGGCVNRKTSRRVIVLDCRSHQWRRLPKMRIPRKNAAADVIDGKIYVIGGCRYNNSDNWGEVYDPKTHTWEPILPTTLDLTIRKSLVPGSLVMGGNVYAMDDMSQLYLDKSVCLVEIESVLLLKSVVYGALIWRDPKADDSEWSKVKGLEGISLNHLIFMTNYSGGRRVKMWWKSVVYRRQGRKRRQTNECKTHIWCAEVSFERRGLGQLWGFVEWSKNMFTLLGCDSPNYFLLHSAMVTH